MSLCWGWWHCTVCVLLHLQGDNPLCLQGSTDSLLAEKLQENESKVSFVFVLLSWLSLYRCLRGTYRFHNSSFFGFDF